MGLRPWEELLCSSETAQLLWEAKKLLKTSWAYDCRDPKHYPINTSYAFAQIKQTLTNKPHDRSAKIELRKWGRPRTLAELIPEISIKAVWEDYNIGSFREAIELAAKVDNVKQSWKAFQTIIRAMETAYIGRFIGPEVLAKPKVNILHTGLDQIAQAAGLEMQTEKGFSGFLDDICPCGLNNHRGAIRKLLRRSSRIHRPK
jgi:hypothetical protein